MNIKSYISNNINGGGYFTSNLCLTASKQKGAGFLLLLTVAEQVFCSGFYIAKFNW